MRRASRRQTREGRSGQSPVAAARPGRSRRHGRQGQSLVEFSLVLTPLFLLLLGIIQFGFIFNAFVTMTNAAREGARTGTIVIYDRGLSQAQNDLARNEAIKTAVLASMNLLGKTSPNFATGSTWTQSGTTYTNGDLKVTYTLPATVTATDARTGYQLTVTATYHQDLIIPIVSNFLPQDAGGRLRLVGEVTMVIN
jgi:Flp pilus assembly protein TadG